MKNSMVWIEQDKKVQEFERKLLVPDERLSNVENVLLSTEEDFNKIPKKGGCYWIATTEPVKHAFHKNPLPKKIDSFEILYNGISKDNIQGRIKQHLLIKKVDPGWSGIRVDILLKPHKGFHRQKAFSSKKGAHLPYIDKIRINSKEDLLKLHLSNEEISYIKNNENKEIFHFKNGINIFHNKHKNFQYKVFFITGLESITYLDFIEKKWRENVLPRLCTYISGR